MKRPLLLWAIMAFALALEVVYFQGSGPTRAAAPTLLTTVGHPATVAAPSGYVGVFVTDTNGHLHERYYVAGSGWFWTDHGTPPGTNGIASSSLSAVAAQSGYVGVFATGNNGHLYERYYDGSWHWTDHGIG